MRKRARKAAAFAAACILSLAAAACSLGGGSTTWQASFSWSPYGSTTPPPMKAGPEGALAEALGSRPVLWVSFGEGSAAGFDAGGRWAAVAADGSELAAPPAPPAVPWALEEREDGFAAWTEEGTFLYRYCPQAGEWRVERLSGGEGAEEIRGEK